MSWIPSALGVEEQLDLGPFNPPVQLGNGPYCSCRPRARSGNIFAGSLSRQPELANKARLLSGMPSCRARSVVRRAVRPSAKRRIVVEPPDPRLACL
jgi:hypothetical protein